MIRSFADQDTERVFRREPVRRWHPELRRAARRKLLMVHAARTLADLSAARGTALEKLEGDRAGQWSIRINQQWRVCFRWVPDGPHDVEITDYH